MQITHIFIYSGYNVVNLENKRTMQMLKLRYSGNITENSKTQGRLQTIQVTPEQNR
jgi:hypothetical protein